MTLRALEGFEGHGTTTGNPGISIVEAAMLKKYAGAYDNGGGARLYAGWGSGFSYCHGRQFAAINNFFRIPVGVAGDVWFLGFAYKPNEVPGEDEIIRFRNSGDAVDHVILAVRGNTGFRFTRGDGTVLADIQNVIFPNRWSYIEIRVVISNTVGQVELKINNVQKILAMSLDTRNGGTSDEVDQIEFRGPGGDNVDNTDQQHTFDDVYVCDDAGSVNNTFLGPLKVTGQLPDSVGDDADFTPSAGANWQNVDENPSDNDTTHNESSTVTNLDLHGMTNQTVIDSGVVGLQVNVEARVTDATTFDVVPTVKSGTTEGAGSAQTVSDQVNFTVFRDVFEQNPDTAAAWTVGELDTMQNGYEVG